MSLKVSFGATHGLRPVLLFSFFSTSRPVFPDWRSNAFKRAQLWHRTEQREKQKTKTQHTSRAWNDRAVGQPPPWLKNRLFQGVFSWILVQIWFNHPFDISSATSKAAVFPLLPLPFRLLSSNRMFWIMLFLRRTLPRVFKTRSRPDQIRFFIFRSLSSRMCVLSWFVCKGICL